VEFVDASHLDPKRGARTGDARAEAWENLLAAARTPHANSGPFVSIRRTGVLAAEADIRQLVGLLLTPHPVAARGVAMAKLLLTDRASPVFNPSSDTAVRTEVRRVIGKLDPSPALAA
jgi:hypothetical protein